MQFSQWQSAKRDRANREEQWRREQEQARLRHEEETRIEKLRNSVARWHDAQRIRAYLTAVQQRAEIREGGVKEGSPVSQFLTWANRYADSLDDSESPVEPEGSDEEY